MVSLCSAVGDDSKCELYLEGAYIGKGPPAMSWDHIQFLLPANAVYSLDRIHIRHNPGMIWHAPYTLVYSAVEHFSCRYALFRGQVPVQSFDANLYMPVGCPCRHASGHFLVF
jgi:hypothetical protein